MDEFLKDLIEYINKGLQADGGFPAKIKVVRAYSKETKIESPQVSLYVISDDDTTRASTFNAEHATIIPYNSIAIGKTGLSIMECLTAHNKVRNCLGKRFLNSLKIRKPRLHITKI